MVMANMQMRLSCQAGVFETSFTPASGLPTFQTVSVRMFPTADETTAEESD